MWDLLFHGFWSFLLFTVMEKITISISSFTFGEILIIFYVSHAFHANRHLSSKFISGVASEFYITVKCHLKTLGNKKFNILISNFPGFLRHDRRKLFWNEMSFLEFASFGQSKVSPKRCKNIRSCIRILRVQFVLVKYNFTWNPYFYCTR